MFNVNAALALVASLAWTASAAVPYLHLERFTATDNRVPSESHVVNFTASNPGAVSEQGGSSPFNFGISWTGAEPPTCWSISGNYYARISPGTYKGANDFKLDVQKYWIYQNSGLNNVTISIAEGKDGYACSRGGQSTICTFQGVEGLNSTYYTSYGRPSPGPIC